MLEEFNEIKVQSSDEIEIAFNELNTGKDKVIIICHGIMQSKDSQIFTKIAREFEENYDIINMDLRGHGRSGGGCTLTSMEVQDLKAVVDYAHKRHKKVGVLGFSLGAATAILESAEYKNIDSLILVSPFTKISKVNFEFWKMQATQTTPAKEFIKACLVTDTNRRIKIGNIFLCKTAPIAVVDKISPTPILFLHGKDDWVIDCSHSQKLYEKAKEPKKLVIFEDAFHAEYIYEKFPEKFKEVCLEWLEETM
ncbi:MAG: alpha/beta fold hydrolase [Nitrospirota bacterium]